jgi:hypothetical protein
MNRNESYPASGVAALDVNLAWATLELVTDSVQDVQVLVSGNESDVDDLRTGLENGKLTVEQPAYGLTPRIAVVRWMQVVVRLPRTWKGVIGAGTVAGCLRASGLTGSDVVLATVSGDLSATGTEAIALRVRTVTGALNLAEARAEKLTLRTVSGLLRVQRGDFRFIRVNSAASDVDLDLDTPMERLDATTVAGDVRITAPLRMACISLRSATGRLRTGGVSITDEGPVIAASTVSGGLTVTCKEQ